MIRTKYPNRRMLVCSQLITLSFLLFERKRLFAPKGANPCDKLHLQLRFLIPLNDLEQIAPKAGRY
jgi:hypothetical protein